MQSTLEPKLSDDPHDVLVVAPDVVLVAPTDQELSKLAHIMRGPSGPQRRTEPDFSVGPAVPPVDTTFRAVPVSRPSFGARALRAIVAFLLAVGIGVAAAAWQAYGDSAQQMIAKWMPPLALTSSPPQENPALAGQPGAPVVQSSAQASAATPQPAPPASTAAAGVAPTAAASSAAEAPSLQSMARDLAAVGQQVEQLKASIEQLKANQEQMSRDVAKVTEAKVSEVKASEVKVPEIKASEQNLRPKISAVSAPLPRPAAPARKPMPPFRPAQAAATQVLPPTAAPYPSPLPPPPAPPPLDPELTSVPRPPLPLRQ
jgi:hypothetical protein